MKDKLFPVALGVVGLLVAGITGCSAGHTGDPVAQPTANPVSQSSTATTPGNIYRRGHAETPAERCALVSPEFKAQFKAEYGMDACDPPPPELRQPQGGQR